MPSVGDTIPVTITTGPEGATFPGPDGTTIAVQPNASITRPGKILRDLGSHFECELENPFGGPPWIMPVPKPPETSSA